MAAVVNHKAYCQAHHQAGKAGERDGLETALGTNTCVNWEGGHRSEVIWVGLGRAQHTSREQQKSPTCHPPTNHKPVHPTTPDLASSTATGTNTPLPPSTADNMSHSPLPRRINPHTALPQNRPILAPSLTPTPGTTCMTSSPTSRVHTYTHNLVCPTADCDNREWLMHWLDALPVSTPTHLPGR